MRARPLQRGSTFHVADSVHSALRSPREAAADGLYQLRGFPPDAINVYLMGDVIVDAGTRHAGRRILRQVAGHA